MPGAGDLEPNERPERPTVVLLHGLGRTARSLARLRRRIEAEGYPTWHYTYPSRKRSIPELATEIGDRIAVDLDGRPLAAVTHSMGGIILRHLAERFDWTHSVMLAPPNRGSAVAEGLRDWWTFRRLYGPAGQQVADGSDWPRPVGRVGVIAGVRGATLSNPTSWLVASLGLLPEGPHDGTVSRHEVVDEWVTDVAEVDASHTWIMNHPDTFTLVLSYLATGRFPGTDATAARAEAPPPDAPRG